MATTGLRYLHFCSIYNVIIKCLHVLAVAKKLLNETTEVVDSSTQ